MNRTLLLWLLLCILAHPTQVHSQDFMEAETAKRYIESQWERSCENPKNKDRWGVREPTEEEIEQFGRGIMVFEYLNNLGGCSDSTEGLGIWFGDVRFLELEVEVLGKKFQNRERITITLDPELPYALQEDNKALLHDSNEHHTWVFYPLLF